MVKRSQKDFEEHVSQLSNEELVAYIHAPEDTYREEAIAFARQVLKSRGLSEAELTRLEELATAQSIRDQTEQSERERLPIAWYWKPWIILCGLYSPSFVLAYILIASSVRFSLSGERRKVRQLWVYAILGLLLFIWLIGFWSQRPIGDPAWIIAPALPLLFVVAKARRLLELSKDEFPQLSDMEFDEMRNAVRASLGIIGISALSVPITSALLYRLTTQKYILIAWSIAIIGLAIAYLFDLKAEGIKKRGKPTRM